MISSAQIIWTQVVPNFIGALMMMSPSRKAKSCQRALSATADRYFASEARIGILVDLGRSQIIHRHHCKRAHTDDKSSLIYEEVGAVVRCSIGKRLIARNDSDEEKQAWHFFKEKGEVLRCTRALIKHCIAV